MGALRILALPLASVNWKFPQYATSFAARTGANKQVSTRISVQKELQATINADDRREPGCVVGDYGKRRQSATPQIFEEILPMDKKQPEGLVTTCAPSSPVRSTTSVAWDDERLAEEGAVAKDPAGEKCISGVKLATVLFSLILVTFLVMLDASIVATAIPQITTHFHSLPDVGWYGSAYLLANCALQPLAGKLYTHFSSKSVYLAFFFIFELGSLLCGLATSSKMFIVSRAIAGLGGAGLINGAITIISASIPLQKRPAYIGGIMGMSQMGVVLGPLIGGALTQYSTWRWCFYLNLPVGGVVAIGLVFVQIPNSHQTRTGTVIQTLLTKLDLMGFAIFAPSVIQLLLALEWGGNTYAWNSATTIGLFCGAGCMFIIFLLWERRKGEEAMIPLSLLKNRVVGIICGVAFFFFAMMQLVTYYLPIYFQAVRGDSPLISGVHLLPSILSQLLAILFSGAAVTKLGFYTPFAIASNVIASIGQGLLSTLTPNSSIGKWIGYQVIVGFGRGLGLQITFIAIQNSVPSSMVPIATSLLTFTQILGGTVILSMGQTIFTASLRNTIPIYAAGVSTAKVIAVGAAGLRQAFPDPQVLGGVLVAYSLSVGRVYYLAIGCSGVAFFLSFGLGWKDIRKEEETVAKAPTEKEGAVAM
ncbi:hypothetical protein O988_00340 [Pseudogymnoascus sp. VKM F-3808]|nr:hypothetical protein O988_00340 [Pseudogymnoascus sp. VKM F-3808]